MQTQLVSASCQGLLAKLKILACLSGLCCTQLAAAADPSPQSTEQLENLMLPPPGWKLDKEVLKTHFWQIPRPFGETLERRTTVYPFWPAFIDLELDDDLRIEKRAPGYSGALGDLLTDALNSDVPKTKKKSQDWLRQSLILYFAGFRLSKIQSDRPYAPWIKPEDGRLLNLITDQYLSRQKVIATGKETQVEVSDEVLAEWMKYPPSNTLANIVGYFDAVQASHDWVLTDFTYPIGWTWLRGQGNKKMVARTGIGDDIYNFHTHWLQISGQLPPTSAPVRLWLRDVYLSYIAGKELFESKTLPLADKAKAALLQDALQQWWAGIEKQK